MLETDDSIFCTEVVHSTVQKYRAPRWRLYTLIVPLYIWLHRWHVTSLSYRSGGGGVLSSQLFIKQMNCPFIAVTCQLYVLPACRLLSGQQSPLPGKLRARINNAASVRLDLRPEYQVGFHSSIFSLSFYLSWVLWYYFSMFYSFSTAW